MEELEQIEYVPEDVIVISDQQTLIETLVKNVREFFVTLIYCKILKKKNFFFIHTTVGDFAGRNSSLQFN